MIAERECINSIDHEGVSNGDQIDRLGEILLDGRKAGNSASEGTVASPHAFQKNSLTAGVHFFYYF
jgi:hypothetical protein